MQEKLLLQERAVSKYKSAEQQNEFHPSLSNTHRKEACWLILLYSYYKANLRAVVLQNSLKAAGSHRKRKRHQSPNLPAFRKSPDSGRKRKRLQETEPPKKRRQTAPTDFTTTIGQKVSGNISEDNINPIGHWIQEGRWPKEYFKQDRRTRKDLEQYICLEGHLIEQEIAMADIVAKNIEQEARVTNIFARKNSSSSLRHKNSEPSLGTPSDQQLREAKSSKYRTVQYEIILATKGSHMKEWKRGITDASRRNYQVLLDTEQTIPKDSLFRDDLFKAICEKQQGRNEAIVIQDITRLIVPSAQNLAIYGDTKLGHLTESVNEGWNSAIPVYGPRPQPDYSVGFSRSAFTDKQLENLKPFVGEIGDSCTSFFMGTWYMYFPFLTCEVKCGAAALDIADRQNAHSMTIAVRAVVELFRYVKREKELDREILAFSISHDHRTVRIYGHYTLIDGNKTTFYRHPIHTFDFTALDGKEKWTAFKFVRNIYNIWMPTHLNRIRSAIDQLPFDLDFGLSQQSELQFPGDSELQLSRELDVHLPQQSDDNSITALEEDSLAGSQEPTPTTSFTQETGSKFRKPGKKRAAEQLSQTTKKSGSFLTRRDRDVKV